MPTVPKGEITIVVHIKRDLHKRFKRWCVDNDVTIQDIVAELIEKKIK